MASRRVLSFATLLLLVIPMLSMQLYAKEASNIRNYADSCYGAGEAYYAHHQYALAMKSYLDALNASEHDGTQQLTAKIYIGIGNLYSTCGDYAMGLRFYRDALSLAQKANSKTLENRILNNLIGASCFSGKITDGERYFRLLADNKEHSAEYKYNLLMCKGLVSTFKKDNTNALHQYRKALAFAHQHNMDCNYTEAVYSCLAQLFADTGRPDSAVYYLKRNEHIARTTNNAYFLAETLRHLSDIYSTTGNTSRAAACRYEYVSLCDSIRSQEDFNAMKDAQYAYEADKSSRKINALTQEALFNQRQIRMQRLWIITLALGFAVFVALLLIVYRQKRQLAEAYNKLFDSSQKLLDNTQDKTNAASEPLPDTRESNVLLSAEQREELVAQIRVIMENTDEICRNDFNIERLAALASSNTRYVSEAINEGFGKNFRTILNECRIKEAMKRLADKANYGSYTIRAISESVGYKSQANFISQFTKMTGMKPSMYQKILKERE